VSGRLRGFSPLDTVGGRDDAGQAVGIKPQEGGVGSYVPWTRVDQVDEVLLANVGEKLIGLSRDDFVLAAQAWQPIRADVPDDVRSYVDAVLGEASSQWQAKPGQDFDPDALDGVIEQSIRGLQPTDLRPIVELARTSNERLGDFVQESLDLLLEMADIAAGR
jgi:hypothetical protein